MRNQASWLQAHFPIPHCMSQRSREINQVAGGNSRNKLSKPWGRVRKTCKVVGGVGLHFKQKTRRWCQQCDTAGKASVCNPSIPQGHKFLSWLPCFLSSFLLVTSEEQQRMIPFVWAPPTYVGDLDEVSGSSFGLVQHGCYSHLGNEPAYGKSPCFCLSPCLFHSLLC